MQAAHVSPEYVQRTHRFAFAVENQISSIQIDANVPGPGIVYGTNSGYRALLPGLHEECLAIALAIGGDFADRLNRLCVHRLIRVFRNKPAMGVSRGYPGSFRDVG